MPKASSNTSYTSKPKYRKSGTSNTSGGISYNGKAQFLVIVESPSKCKKIEDYLG